MFYPVCLGAPGEGLISHSMPSCAITHCCTIVPGWGWIFLEFLFIICSTKKEKEKGLSLSVCMHPNLARPAGGHGRALCPVTERAVPSAVDV